MKLNILPKQEYSLAIVIPCYNEEKRLPYNDFVEFAEKNPEVILCFVNDGSKDQTLPLLRGLAYRFPLNVCVHSLEKNSGKSEAVRQGMMYVYNQFDVDQIGFLDADLATRPNEILDMSYLLKENNQYGAIVGSRIQRLGASITRDDNRSILSLVVKSFIRFILRTNFQDSQCGAKVFKRTIIPHLFKDSFLTPWLFDVEIFLRLQKKFGKSTLSKGVLEFPLMSWMEVAGSKIKALDAILIPKQLVQLHLKYNVLPSLKKRMPILNNEKGFKPALTRFVGMFL